MRRIILVGIMASALMLAGCIGGDGAEESDLLENAQVTEDTGGIQGIVTNEAIEAVSGVTVTLDETGETKESRLDGSFAFSELPPDTYTLVLEGDGFLTAEETVDVSAAEVSFVDIVLSEQPTRTPYMQQDAMTGFIECSVRAGFGVAVCAIPNAAMGIIGQDGNATNDRFLLPFQIEPDPWQMVVEADWDASQRTAERMSIPVEPFGLPNDRQTEFASTVERPPVVMTTDRDRFIEVDQNTTAICEGEKDPQDPALSADAESYCDRNYTEEGGDAYIRLFTAGEPVQVPDAVPEVGGASLGFGVAFQEEFDIFTTVFYHAPACEDFSLLLNNECSQAGEPLEDEHTPKPDE